MVTRTYFCVTFVDIYKMINREYQKIEDNRQDLKTLQILSLCSDKYTAIDEHRIDKNMEVAEETLNWIYWAVVVIALCVFLETSCLATNFQYG